MIECADVPDNVLNYGIPNEECCIVNELKGDVSDNGQNNDIEETLDEQVEQLVSKYRTPIRKDTFINLCREIEYNEFVKQDVYELATVTSLSDVENANDKVINALAYMVVTRPSNRISILNTSYIGRKFLDMLLEYDMEHALVSSVLHEAINKFSHRQGNRITFEKFIKKFYK